MNAFIPALDNILQDLTLRFQNHQKTVFNLSYLLPKACLIEKQDEKNQMGESLQRCYEIYKSILNEDSSIGQFTAECEVWTNLWRRAQSEVPTSAVAALDKCDTAAFPNVSKLLQILAVLPISTAEAERVFSKVTRTLTSIRSTMLEERLEALILIQAHRDMLPPPNEVADYFCESDKRRLSLRKN